MKNQRGIEPIIGSSEIPAAISLVKDVVEMPHHLVDTYLISKKWEAVPVQSASHFNKKDAELLAKAAHFFQTTECIAVATEQLENMTSSYRVEMTQDGLLQFSQECAHFNFVLAPEILTFVILCTVEDYYLVAGPPEFVTRALGMSIKDAREEFLAFANDKYWSASVRKNLRSVAKRYDPLKKVKDSR